MIKAILIDDETPALKELKYFLSAYENVIIAGMYTNPVDALNYMKEDSIDLVFLDIDMPLVNGIQIAANIKSLYSNIEIIFVTAHQEYAINAFEVQALDYVLKPIMQNRFHNVMQRIFKVCNLNQEDTDQKESVIVQCFGKFQLINNQNTILNDTIKWRTNKVKELLAYLISRYGKSNTKQDLISVLFKDFEMSKALNNLYVTMFYLRKQLEELGVLEQAVRIEDNYTLEIKKGICDFVDFDLFTKSNIKIQENNIQEAERLIQLYQDDFLAEEDYDWLLDIREYLHGKYEDLIIKVAEYYENIGDSKKVLSNLQKLIAFNSLHDEGHRKLLEHYYNTNNYRMYVKQYKLYERVLLEELNIKPEKQFIKLYHQIISVGI